jgi:peptide/nickel transport system ATP-binding protein
MSTSLAINNLTIGYRATAKAPPTVVVKGVDLLLEPGRILGLAGESGCGKSTTALAAIGYPIPGSVRLSGTSLLGDTDLLSVPRQELRRIWGRRISYVAQDAALALNPVKRVSWLIAEPMSIHLGVGGSEAHTRSVALLESVGIRNPEEALRRYPHQFSGGQQQRIALAIALACEPEVLVLDEPTTGLDVTTQAQISVLICEIVRNTAAAALYISHDLALLATVCDEIAIMYAGEVMERAAAKELYAAPLHPYSAALIDSAPRIDDGSRTVGIPGLPPPHVIDDACPYTARCPFAIDRCRVEHPQLVELRERKSVRCLRAGEIDLAAQRVTVHARARTDVAPSALTVTDLHCSYQRGGSSETLAVDGVSFSVSPGETLGIVGESGSGKSTILRAIAGLHTPISGEIRYEGAVLQPHARDRPRDVRQAIQIVFQNPDSSLNPRHTVGSIVERPLRLFFRELSKRQRRERALELLSEVRLDPALIDRYPRQLSGGQKQRVAVARAFAAQPRLILCDEVVSALDVSVQASILDLVSQLTAEHHTAVLFVTHDLAVVRSIADRICVLQHGSVRETGETGTVFDTPEHTYTQELLGAVPRLETGRARPPED